MTCKWKREYPNATIDSHEDFIAKEPHVRVWNLMSRMITKYKYPRTFHLPFSLCISSDDKRLSDDNHFIGKYIVMTEKMDGENTTVYPNNSCHARSLDGYGKPWQTWMMKNVQSWAYNLPETFRVCGECIYAQHSIKYNLTNEYQYFQVFGIWDGQKCLSWIDTVTWCYLLGLQPVPVIYHGIYDKDLVMDAFKRYSKKENREIEGFVIRLADEFLFEDFGRSVAKYVRKDHVITDDHWTKNWRKNEINSGTV